MCLYIIQVSALCAARQAHAPEIKNKSKNKTAPDGAKVCAEPLANASPFPSQTVFLFLIRFRHFFNGFPAGLPDVCSFVKAGKIVEEQEFLLASTYPANDIVVEDVRNKILRKISAVDEFFSRFFHVFHDIRNATA